MKKMILMDRSDERITLLLVVFHLFIYFPFWNITNNIDYNIYYFLKVKKINSNKYTQKL